MAKRNRITSAMSKTIAESSPLIKSAPKNLQTSTEDELIEVDLLNLIKNPYQPRINMNTNSLNELVCSIEKNGLMQPIVVTKKNDHYIIVAGHRRAEAHKILGKKSIKATVLHNVEDQSLAILALTENMVREDLHPVENALSMKYILDEGVVGSQNQLAEHLGLSKGYISKLMSLLHLPSELIKIIKDENYKTISVLVLLNKIPAEQILSAFEAVKTLNRIEAEKYLMKNYFQKKPKEIQRYISKISKNKINVEINIKDLDAKLLDAIQLKLEEIAKDLQKNEF